MVYYLLHLIICCLFVCCFPQKEVPYNAAYLYDAVYQYAKALDKTLGRNELPTGRNVVDKMLNTSYESKLYKRLGSCCGYRCELNGPVVSLVYELLSVLRIARNFCVTNLRFQASDFN